MAFGVVEDVLDLPARYVLREAAYRMSFHSLHKQLC